MPFLLKPVRFGWRLVWAFARRHLALILLGGGVGVGLAVLAAWLLPKKVWVLPTVRVGLVGGYDVQTLPEFIQLQITQGLTRVEENQEVRPGLAESWQTEEGKTWVFKLKESKWQDGTELRAWDIRYGFSDVEIQPLNEREISFTLETPFAPLPAVLSRPVFKRGLLGTGPYKVEQIKETRGNIELLKLAAGSDDNPNLIYKFYPTEMMAKTAFKLGEVDRLVEMSEAKEFLEWKKVKVEPTIHWDRYVAIFFNTQEKGLEDKAIRQALAYGLRKDEAGEARAISPIHPKSWAYNPQVKTYEYNLEKAQKLLDDNLSRGDSLELSLVALPSLLGEAERIKQEWEALGVRVHIQVSNFPPESYQAVLVTQLVGEDPDQYSLWHSSQKGSNLAKYTNLRIDKLLEDGRRVIDREKRQEIYFDFQRFLVEDCPAIFLYHPTTYTVIRD